MNNYSIIKTEEQYNQYLQRAEELMDCEKDCDELELLAILISDYESKKYPIDPPDYIKILENIQKFATDLETAGTEPYPSSQSDFMEGYYNGQLDAKIEVGARLRYILENSSLTSKE